MVLISKEIRGKSLEDPRTKELIANREGSKRIRGRDTRKSSSITGNNK